MSFDNIWKILKPQGTVLVETHICDNHFVLGDGRVTTLKDIDRRLLDVPLFRFYRTNELNPADWSNWFGRQRRGHSRRHALGRLHGNPPCLLGRGAFQGLKNPAVPARMGTWQLRGHALQLQRRRHTWTTIWHDPRDGALS